MKPTPLDTPEESRALDRHYMVGLLCMLVLIVAFPLYKLSEPERRERTQEAMREENIALGGAMFAQHCAACHGDNAAGGRGFPTLGSKEFLASVSDRQLQWLISGGVPGTAMTAYDMDLGGPFTAQEILRIVTYLRSMEEHAPSVPGWFKGAAAPHRREREAASERRDTSTTDHDDARERRAQEHVDLDAAPSATVFAARCAACHGVNAEGSPIAPAIPTITAQRLDSVVAKISAGVPGTAMMPFATSRGGPLDDATIQALVGWLQRKQEPSPQGRRRP